MSLFNNQKNENENEVVETCQNCRFFEKRTHFCRINPPQVVVFLQVEKDVNGDQIFLNKSGTKFPCISLPDKDYCSNFKASMFLD